MQNYSLAKCTMFIDESYDTLDIICHSDLGRYYQIIVFFDIVTLPAAQIQAGSSAKRYRNFSTEISSSAYKFLIQYKVSNSKASYSSHMKNIVLENA